ncbi:hypothetical protein FDK21_03190 [Cohaesibacter sp. CAU 1516]|uniref:fumarylacetoacetate hydrolase family protein n=1 Tax=Cohaesibacter sp. CAU 1516 TaxID=2576038 RepID=UPI0010FE602C|nr:fumarylacetoacetate hydrolase family protein [Cohaesibacter sp. CAU 1516]TLP48679.1 hypothetical protein FDK21_03190 [Cohaesibacter sp. CAU 1516]
MRYFYYIIVAIAACYGALFVALQLPMVSRTQPIEAALPISQLANPAKALTFARANVDGMPHMLLVTELTGQGAKAIDLSVMAGRDLNDPFDALDHFGRPALVQMADAHQKTAQSFDQTQLLAAVQGSRHISFGTNFLDHGTEVHNETPFYFPRLTEPTPSISSLAIDPEHQMIDYEVELCMSFDRPIAKLEDFDAARKLVFLCGDFSDRKVMLDGMPDNEETLSGIGFTDAKSLPGFFPTGPYMVVPDDWQAFIASEVIGTSLNGEPMQLTTGNMMIEDFRSMTDIALKSGSETKWTHHGNPVGLLPTGRIETQQVLLSGTTEGVLFRPPSLKAKITLGAKYAMTGRFLTGMSGFRSVVNDSINAAITDKIMLMPGDKVKHHSSRLGMIVTTIKKRNLDMP